MPSITQRIGQRIAGRIGMTLRAATVIAAGVVLAGCASSGTGGTWGSGIPKHLRPIQPETVALMSQKGMTAADPILIRAFKKESELEVWKRGRSGRFELLRTYKICAWGGNVGPKIVEGDKQSPEGFYTVRPTAMNPNSQYHLSFDVGYPNAFDRSYGRTGSAIMVHGDCSSAGCFAMTNSQVEDIYALAREAFRGGQPAFQMQVLPFRMTAENMARHRRSPHVAFWKNLKEGNDHFELTQLEPRVEVCGRRYVFNPQTGDGAASFEASAPCPSYEIAPAIRTALAEKERKFEAEKAIHVARLEDEEHKAVAETLERSLARTPISPTLVAEARETAPRGGLFGALGLGSGANAAKAGPTLVAAAALTPAPAGLPVPRPAPARAGAPAPVTVAAAPDAATPGAGDRAGWFSNVFSFGKTEAPADGVIVPASSSDPAAAAALAPAPAGLPIPQARPATPGAPAVSPSATTPAAAAPVAEPAAPEPAGEPWWKRVNPFSSAGTARPAGPVGPSAARAPAGDPWTALSPQLAATPPVDTLAADTLTADTLAFVAIGKGDRLAR